MTDEPYEREENEVEEPDAEDCPLIGAAITSGSHLLLTLAEAQVGRLAGRMAHCYTDSAFISPSKTGERSPALLPSSTPMPSRSPSSRTRRPKTRRQRSTLRAPRTARAGSTPSPRNATAYSLGARTADRTFFEETPRTMASVPNKSVAMEPSGSLSVRSGLSREEMEPPRSIWGSRPPLNSPSRPRTCSRGSAAWATFSPLRS